MFYSITTISLGPPVAGLRLFAVSNWLYGYGNRSLWFLRYKVAVGLMPLLTIARIVATGGSGASTAQGAPG